jgi:hypothetical protein
VKVWKLINIKPDSINWNANICNRAIEYVIVRALNEREARELVDTNLTRAGIRKPGENTIGSPWLNPTETSCIFLENTEFSLEGDPAILEVEYT